MAGIQASQRADSVSVFYYQSGDRLIERALPGPTEELVQGVLWGCPETLFTPAYWVTQYWMRTPVMPSSQRMGSSFREEVVACLLGGYGIPAEIGVAAFYRLRERNLIQAESCEIDELAKVLHEPLTVNGLFVRYRFWLQKAKYVSLALEYLTANEPPAQDPFALRDYLLKIPGIGPKTASWIVRNWLDSDAVAILDIHIVRAGVRMGLYSESDKVSKRYFQMERRFLDLATAMNVPARMLDALIWSHMRHSPPAQAKSNRVFTTAARSYGQSAPPLLLD
jgi:N-glycosylase/DNA lyase